MFLILALDGDEWSASCPSHFISGVSVPGTHWIGSWVAKRKSLHCPIKNPVIKYGSISSEISLNV